jgi:transposase-like protein
MSAPDFLQIVSDARELRDAAALELRRAIGRASEAGHSVREIARAAGWKNPNAAHYYIRKEREGK